MKAGRGMNPSKLFKKDLDNPGDINEVKENIKVGIRIDPARHCISEQNASEKEAYFPGKLVSGLNTNNRKSQKSNNPKNQEEVMDIVGKSKYFISASVDIHRHTL